MSTPKNFTLEATALLAILYRQLAQEILTVMKIRNRKFCSDKPCVIRIDDPKKIFNIHFLKEELKLPA